MDSLEKILGLGEMDLKERIVILIHPEHEAGGWGMIYKLRQHHSNVDIQDKSSRFLEKYTCVLFVHMKELFLRISRVYSTRVETMQDFLSN